MENSKTKRPICTGCHYPKNVCVCEAIKPLKSDVKIIILQHPSETNHPKNTARLLQLNLPDTQCITGCSEKDFVSIKQACQRDPQNYWVLYPSEKSQALEDICQQPSPTKPEFLILIDATWGKAYKIWQLNPWLQNLQCCHFQHTPASRYMIRKTSKKSALSTIEAAAYALQVGYKIDVSSLYQLMDKMQAHWRSFEIATEKTN